jgi:hypothetical protein
MSQVITDVKNHVNRKFCGCTGLCGYLSVTCSAKTTLSGLYMERIHYRTTHKQIRAKTWKTHGDSVLRLLQNGIHFSTLVFTNTSKEMNRRLLSFALLNRRINKFTWPTNTDRFPLITAEEITKVDTILNVSNGNRILTSSLPATERTVVLDMQTE